MEQSGMGGGRLLMVGSVGVLVVIGAVVLFGVPGRLPAVESALLDPDGSFTLCVSNQSFDARRIDIQVEVDGELVIAEWFRVGNQHVYKGFNLALEPGEHRIRIWSRKGQADYSGTFEAAEGKTGLLCYWYTRKGDHPRRGERFFTVRVFDGPLIIM